MRFIQNAVFGKRSQFTAHEGFKFFPPSGAAVYHEKLHEPMLHDGDVLREHCVLEGLCSVECEGIENTKVVITEIL